MSASDLKRNLINPYRLGKSIYYEGNILSPSEISKIQITETKRPHQEELKTVQEESFRKVQELNRSSSSVAIISIGYGYKDYEINMCGADVTNKYISSGPGVGTPMSSLAEFIKHPWVVRVVGGLVFVVVAAYLGLK
jgi:hypothetical protein